ncbi:unnamed protein product [Brassicogethes aeneus]|uniref:Uncharacterized protein n=1 Tax=Brassicogethes aeneus TaxID=1431903 RepID=A0A9P0B348_BRAAE|nr:unnamed protein product [Brassicogethes aeneus]
MSHSNELRASQYISNSEQTAFMHKSNPILSTLEPFQIPQKPLEVGLDLEYNQTLPSGSGTTQSQRELSGDESRSDPFGSDDSRADPDFSSTSSSNTDSSSSSSSESDENEPPRKRRKVVNINKTKKQGKKRLRNPDNWRKNKAKALRNNGKKYISVSKKQRTFNERVMQLACGEKCKLQCSQKISEEERQTIFNEYWKLGDLQRQRDFLATNMTLVSPKYQYKRENSHRQQNNAFYFVVRNQKIRVCKLFFKATLSINDRPIRTVVNKKKLTPTGHFIESDMRGRHKHHTKIDESIKNGVRNHISKIPKIDSHYTRANTTKQFIEGGKTIADLHRDYVKDFNENKLERANYNLYAKIFNEEFNLSFFVPKKDQCDHCISFEQMSDEEKALHIEEYNQHHKEKELSRAEKKEIRNLITS